LLILKGDSQFGKSTSETCEEFPGYIHFFNTLKETSAVHTGPQQYPSPQPNQYPSSLIQMAGSKETQRIEESLELQEIDKDIFKSIKVCKYTEPIQDSSVRAFVDYFTYARSLSQLWKFTRGVGAFGGNIIAQAAHAATKTVQLGYHLHSLHVSLEENLRLHMHVAAKR
jgi:hypothetical protein